MFKKAQEKVDQYITTEIQVARKQSTKNINFIKIYRIYSIKSGQSYQFTQIK